MRRLLILLILARLTLNMVRGMVMRLLELLLRLLRRLRVRVIRRSDGAGMSLLLLGLVGDWMFRARSSELNELLR